MRLLICAFALMMMASCGDDEDPVVMEPDPMVPVLEITPEDGGVSVSSTEQEIVYHHFIKSNSEEDINLLWSMKVDQATYPIDWIYFYCDSNQCYLPDFKDCPPSAPNLITFEETKDWQLHVQPNGLSGTHTITMEFYAESDPTEVLATYPVEVTVNR